MQNEDYSSALHVCKICLWSVLKQEPVLTHLKTLQGVEIEVACVESHLCMYNKIRQMLQFCEKV